MLEVSDEEIGDSLLGEINSVRNLTTTAPRKYDSLKGAFLKKTGANVAVCYLSDMSRMWTPRVGQALLSRNGHYDSLRLLETRGPEYREGARGRVVRRTGECEPLELILAVRRAVDNAKTDFPTAVEGLQWRTANP